MVMRDWVRERLAYVLDICYPRRCEGCGGVPERSGTHLCWDCLAEAHYIGDPMCSCCGDPVEGVVEHVFECGWCRRTHPAFDAARSAVRFRGAIKLALHRYKYQRATYLASDFGALLEGCIHAHYASHRLDAITYVPLHPQKARERSFNQARLLAEELGRRMKLPVTRNVLERVRLTQTQTRLSAEERKANVSGAFRAGMPDWIGGRHWVLVDDVMTTGATVDECARVLKAHGAASVLVATVARG